mgnify:CR=1 FL=1
MNINNSHIKAEDRYKVEDAFAKSLELWSQRVHINFI